MLVEDAGGHSSSGQDDVLSTGDVDIWQAAAPERRSETDRLQTVLSDAEISTARGFHFERDRGTYVTARALLRLLMAAHLHASPRDITFGYGPHGKPRLLDPSSGLTFNLSHSAGAVLVAVARGGEIGVDLERIRPLADMDRLALEVFSAPELAYLQALHGKERAVAFFRGWTRKEALMKGLGLGLSLRPQAIPVSLSDSGEPMHMHTEHGDAAVDGWTIFPLNVGEDFVGALALGGMLHSLRYRRWIPGPLEPLEL